MYKTISNSLLTGIMALFLVTACAEDSTDPGASAEQQATESGTDTAAQGESIMDQPVDFSSPENVEKTLLKIREEAGDTAYKNLENAFKYIKVYDLSVGNNDEKLYRKLDGRTPNEIIAKMRR